MSSRRPILFGILVALGAFVLLAPRGALAHARSLSYSSLEWTAEGARIRVRVPLLELSRLAIRLPLADANEDEDEVGRYLASHLRLETPAGVCAPRTAPARLRADEGWVAYGWEVHCADASAARSLETGILLAEAPSHLHFVRVSLPAAAGPARVLERVLSEAEPRWDIPNPGATTETRSAPGASFSSYVALGIEHILTGWDHLAFVLALILLARSLGEVARLVTGFTLAHSLTLALAVLGLVHTDSRAVEAAIGFSVALLAAENAWLLAGQGPWIPVAFGAGLFGLVAMSLSGVGSLSPLVCLGLALFSLCHFGLLSRSRDPALQRVALAFAFGLIHGFGFAGVLAELELPTARLAPALLGFNVGVEIGQLGVVALAWPLLLIAKRDQPLGRSIAELGSAGICGLGLFWFVTRAFGA